MLSLDEIGTKMDGVKLTHICEKTGLSYMTVWKIKHGLVQSVNSDTLEKLSEYFDRK